MSFENMSLQLDEQQKLWPTDEDINKSKSGVEYSQKLTKVNNVLQVLDFPDNKEEVSRNILSKQDNQTLEDLATKSKDEILTFLYKEKMKSVETKEQSTIENNDSLKEQHKENDKKYQDIKNILPKWVFDSGNSEFKNLRENLAKFEASETSKEKTEIIKNIIAELKNPKVLPAIVKELWGADRSNPQYVELRNTLVGLDSSFLPIFQDLENINFWASFNTNDIIDGIETDSGGIIDIDIGSDKAISKMSLIWSDYSFDEELDKKAFDEVMGDNSDKIEKVKDSSAVLKGAYAPFGGLLNNISQVWGKPDFKTNLQGLVKNFPKDSFSGLDDMYEDMKVDPSIQISQSDIDGLADHDSASELQWKIANIQEKFTKINSQIWKVKDMVIQKYNQEFKELLERKSEAKKKQLETLKFMKTSGFDLMPKEISNRIIRELKSGMLTIPWLDLSIKNINLKNGNFWESSVFIDKEAWINIESKRNLVKFINKMISWNIGEPLNTETIASGVAVVDPLELKHKFIKAGINDGLGWKYTKIMENLRTK